MGRYAWGVHGMCSYAWDVHRMCSYAWDVHGMCSYAWDVHGMCRYAWDVHGMCRYAWDVQISVQCGPEFANTGGAMQCSSIMGGDSGSDMGSAAPGGQD